MHIHPSSPNSSISEENAATKIQANFRGYRVRKQMKDTPSSTVTATTTIGSTAASPRRPNEVGAKRLGHDAAADPAENKSAIKIQAGIRGYLVRKKQKLAADAATIIQANFRGFKTRRELKQRTSTINWIWIRVRYGIFRSIPLHSVWERLRCPESNAAYRVVSRIICVRLCVTALP